MFNHKPTRYHPLQITFHWLVARSRLPQPVPAETGHPFLDRIGKLIHYGLYILVFLMVISGLSLSIQTDLFPIVFGSSGAALPPDFLAYNARSLHGMVARGLVVLVGLHVGAALYHEIWIKDKLMARMWFGKKNGRQHEMQGERP